MANVLEITVGLIVVIASFIYIREQLDREYMWDVLAAVIIFGAALIYMYVNVTKSEPKPKFEMQVGEATLQKKE